MADEIGSSLPVKKLGIEIGMLNNLAKKAKMSEDKVLDLFKDALKTGKKLGLPAVTTLESTSKAISFRIALEEEGSARPAKDRIESLTDFTSEKIRVRFEGVKIRLPNGKDSRIEYVKTIEDIVFFTIDSANFSIETTLEGNWLRLHYSGRDLLALHGWECQPLG